MGAAGCSPSTCVEMVRGAPRPDHPAVGGRDGPSDRRCSFDLRPSARTQPPVDGEPEEPFLRHSVETPN